MGLSAACGAQPSGSASRMITCCFRFCLEEAGWGPEPDRGMLTVLFCLCLCRVPSALPHRSLLSGDWTRNRIPPFRCQRSVWSADRSLSDVNTQRHLRPNPDPPPRYQVSTQQLFVPNLEPGAVAGKMWEEVRSRQ